jgi:ribosomal RNA-processing protein 17
LREERKQELEEHVQAVNALLKDVNLPTLSSPSSDTSWDGIPDEAPETIDHEEEYISEDEDKYTTVTVEAVEVNKEGLQRVRDEDEEEWEEVPKLVETEGKGEGKEKEGKKWPKKEKKKKFRYESKAERKVTRGKQKAGNKARADARRGGD